MEEGEIRMHVTDHAITVSRLWKAELAKYLKEQHDTVLLRTPF